MAHNKQLPILSLYERMKAKGIDMGWYERGSAAIAKRRSGDMTPLEEDECGQLSLYLWQADGELWTFAIQRDNVKPHRRVRTGTKPGPFHPADGFICMSCKHTFTSFKSAQAHYAPKRTETEGVGDGGSDTVSAEATDAGASSGDDTAAGGP